MHLVFKALVVAACVVVSTTDASNLRHDGRALAVDNSRSLSSITAVENSRQLSLDFNGVDKEASPMRIGEEVLKEVNDILVDNVSGKKLLDVCAKVKDDHPSVTDDPETKKIAKALVDVLHKLFPGTTINDILSRVLPALQASASKE